MKPIGDYPDTVEVISNRKPNVKLGWHQDFRMAKQNDFYESHPELWNDPVQVVIPEIKGLQSLFKWQAGETFLTSMPEISSFHDLIHKEPERMLDIGCGIGRTSVYLMKRFNWQNTEFHLLDGDGREIKYGIDEEGKNDFYNKLQYTAAYCGVNEMSNYIVHNAAEDMWRFLEYDFVISTLAFGYHWDFNRYLSKLNIKKGALIIFGTRGFDQRQDGGAFTNKQLAQVDYNKFKLIRDVRVRENLKASCIILKKR